MKLKKELFRGIVIALLIFIFPLIYFKYIEYKNSQELNKSISAYNKQMAYIQNLHTKRQVKDREIIKSKNNFSIHNKPENYKSEMKYYNYDTKGSSTKSKSAKNIVIKDVKINELIVKDEIILDQMTKYEAYNEMCEVNILGEAYDYFNFIREKAGMIHMDINYEVENAAQSHSEFLFKNQEWGSSDYLFNGKTTSRHHEHKSLEGFTGEKVTDRVIRAGHNAKFAGEGISTGGYKKTTKSSIDSLMSAIYHRFGILVFNKNQIGIGMHELENNCLYNFVHNNTNSYFDELCRNNQVSSSSKVYSYCGDADVLIEGNDYWRVLNKVMSQNPDYVIWPSNYDNDVWTKFINNENPNPMPNYEETGYPVSIQFNPYKFKKPIKFISFKIFDDYNNEIKKTHILRKETDHNNRFSSWEFALFPIEKLEKNSTYNVEFSYLNNFDKESVRWSFTTGSF